MRSRQIITILLVLTALTGCHDYDESIDSGAVSARLAFSVSPSSQTTRSSADVVQAFGAFRGLQELKLIPFTKQGKVEVGDQPKLFGLASIHQEDYAKTGAHFYYFDDCKLIPGVASFLVYARATTPDEVSLENSKYYGALTAVCPENGDPAGITFSPTPIWSEQDAPAEAYAIADYLTSIAMSSCQYQKQTYSWRSAADSKLRTFYLNFINETGETAAPIAASSADVRSHAQALKKEIESLTYSPGTPEQLLCAAIVSAIDKGSALPANYPASVGLPAGAAVVRWNGSQFEPQTTTTTLAKISSIRRYAFPAELYYYTNSQIKTTTTDKRNSYYQTENSWTSVLGQYEYDNGVVTRNTTSVAIKEPIRYAVGCLQVKLNPVSQVSLPDADGQDVNFGPTSFPLTGIIVGSQRPVAYDFRPASASEVDVHFVYDSSPIAPDNSTIYLPASGSSVTANTNTLLLQTPDGEEVTIMAEFQNNTGTTFRGLSGLVHPGTRFYLMGTLAPMENATQDYQKRVITQGYTTTLNVTINSLSKAYNVLPDILTERLEIGIQLTPDWEMAKPTELRIEN